MTLNLSPIFIQNIITAFGDPGRHFLTTLPDRLIEAAKRWDLTLGDPFLLSYNYVCAVTRGDGTPAVLKIGVPDCELVSEIKTLRVYDGQGACRLLDADFDRGMLLLERLQPGRMLASLKTDDLATDIAAGVMQAIHQPVPTENRFLSLRGWFDGLKNLPARFNGGTGPFPRRTVGTVGGMINDIFSEDHPQVLLHGDFHHFNILLSERGWLVIDPKGVVGPAEYEVAPLLLNPWGEMLGETEALQRTERRIAILSERLGFDPQRLWVWAVCYSLLSSWWDTADNGSGGEYARAWTEILLKKLWKFKHSSPAI